MKSSHPTGLHFHRRNPHPNKGEHCDCVTRAIVLATGKPYSMVFNGLHDLMQDHDIPGTPKGGCLDSVARVYLNRRCGWDFVSLPTGTQFKADNLPELCIAVQAGHYVLVAKGSIWDTFDSRGKRRKKLTGYYEPGCRAAAVASDWVSSTKSG